VYGADYRASHSYFRAIRDSGHIASLRGEIDDASGIAARSTRRKFAMTQRTMCAILLAVGATLSVSANAANQKLSECVDLSEARSLKRAGAQYLYVADGSEHYRLSFAGGSCGQMTVTSKLSLKTGDDENRICPSDTKLVANGHNCRVSGVELLAQEDFARLTRRQR
jgi:hypothetical protein